MRTTLAALVLLVTVSATAGITSLTPASFDVNSGEHFITVNGTDLGDEVVYSGPAGTFTLAINAADPASVTAWVPLQIIATPGTYSLIVRSSKGDAGPAYFDVRGGFKRPLYLIIPERLIAIAGGRFGASIQYEVSADGGEDPQPVIDCDPKSGSVFPFGASTIECFATNRFGEKAQASIPVTVYDATPPVLKLPERLAVTADSREGAYVRYEAFASDDVDGQLAVECDPKPGSFFPVGETSVRCTATDLSLNAAARAFLVEVVEKESTLRIHVPEAVVVEAESGEGKVVDFEVRTSGSLDPQPEVSCDPPSGYLFPVRTTKVLCRAADRFGGRAEATFEVNVIDTTPPSLRLERPIVEATDGKEMRVFFKTGATDAVDGSADVACKPESGSYFPIGETSVECTATDRARNVASGQTVVSVVDTIPPVIDGLRVSPEIIEKANGEMVRMLIEVSAFDAVDPMPQCQVVDVTANEEIDDDWIVENDLDLQLRAETNGKDDRRYDLLIGCKDDFGNSAFGILNVTVLAGASASSGEVTAPLPTTTKRRSARP